MEIKPETVKKVVYPVAAAVTAATVLSACQQQQQLAGEPPAPVPYVEYHK